MGIPGSALETQTPLPNLRDRLLGTRAGRALTTLATIAGASTFAGLALPNNADSQPTPNPPYPPGGCVDNGLNSSGGVFITFGSDPTVLELDTSQINDISKVCAGSPYSREIDIYEEIENDSRTGFVRNTGTVVIKGLGRPSQNPIPLKEFNNSAICLPDGQARLRRLWYKFEMINNNGGKSFYSMTDDVQFPIQPGNNCADNTQDLKLEGTVDKQGVLASKGHQTADLPLIRNRRPMVHKRGIKVDLRGYSKVPPKKTSPFEVVTTANKAEKVTMVVQEGSRHLRWQEHLRARQAFKHFFGLAFPRLKLHEPATKVPVTVEAFDSKHHLLFEEREIVTDTRLALAKGSQGR